MVAGRHATRATTLWSVLFVAWLGCILALFYAVKEQKPIRAGDIALIADAGKAFTQAPSWLAVADSALNLLTASLIVLFAGLVGARLNILSYPHTGTTEAHLEFWLLSVPIGLTALAILTLVLSVFGWLTLPGVASLALVLLILSKPQTFLARVLYDARALRAARLQPLVAAFVVLSLLLSLCAALAPPTAWDALVYHLTVPLHALATGRLAPSGDIVPHENFPMLMSALYLLAMFVKGDIAAQLLHFAFGMLTLGLIALAARRGYGHEMTPYALLLALSMPMLLLLSSWAYNDVALTCYTVAAVYTYQRWHDTDDRRYVLVCGVMCGSALGLKYTSFVLPLGILIMALYDHRFVLRSAQARLLQADAGAGACARRFLAPLGAYALVTTLVALPWYVKNLAFVGNPVYPFVFGGPQWDAMRTAWYARAGTGIGPDPVALLTLPLVATLGTRDANFYDGRVGPLLLLLAPLFILNRPRVDRFVFMFLLQTAFWVAGVMSSASLWQTRLLLPALALLAPPLGAALVSLKQYDRPSFSLRRVTSLVIALVLALAFVRQGLDTLDLNPFAFIVGAESREHFLTRNLGDHADAMLAINRLPASARVQFMWEPRSYLAHVSTRADPLLDALPHLVAVSGSIDGAVQALKHDGFTHVLVFDEGARFTFTNLSDEFTAGAARDLATLESDYTRVVYANSSYRLLELK